MSACFMHSLSVTPCHTVYFALLTLRHFEGDRVLKRLRKVSTKSVHFAKFFKLHRKSTGLTMGSPDNCLCWLVISSLIAVQYHCQPLIMAATALSDTPTPQWYVRVCACASVGVEMCVVLRLSASVNSCLVIILIVSYRMCLFVNEYGTLRYYWQTCSRHVGSLKNKFLLLWESLTDKLRSL